MDLTETQISLPVVKEKFHSIITANPSRRDRGSDLMGQHNKPISLLGEYLSTLPVPVYVLHQFKVLDYVSMRNHLKAYSVKFDDDAWLCVVRLAEAAAEYQTRFGDNWPYARFSLKHVMWRSLLSVLDESFDEMFQRVVLDADVKHSTMDTSSDLNDDKTITRMLKAKKFVDSGANVHFNEKVILDGPEPFEEVELQELSAVGV